VIYEAKSALSGVYALGDLGEFRTTKFRDVIRGEVEDLKTFLREVEARILPPHFLPVKRVVPIDQWFRFSPEKFLDIAKERARRYVKKVKKGESFCVRVERRGMRGVLSSKDLEREIGRYFFELLKEEHGEEPRVNLTDPDKLIAIEIVGNLAGMSLVSRELREFSRLVRVK